MKKSRNLIATLALMLVSFVSVHGQGIKGIVVDRVSKEPLIGAIVQIEGTGMAAVTDIEGKFHIAELKQGKYALTVKYMSYKSQNINGIQVDSSKDVVLEISMEADEQELNEVMVTAMERKDTEVAMIQATKQSSVVVSNISSQEIKRSQDTNAGEVIRRVPGVSLIDEKFVMVRGLSQRYNNVWINGGAVPSSEADSRAFSFDIIPSSQLDNLMIVKVPTAEYPADYTGGFILVNTREIPSTNQLNIAVGGVWNSSSTFRNSLFSQSSSTDFLGFDGGLRSLEGGMNSRLNTIGRQGIDLLNNGLDNDWKVTDHKPIGDLKLSADWNHYWTFKSYKLGMIAAVNYSNEHRTYIGMQNNLYGAYDIANDRSNYLRHSVDNQYNHNVRLGAMYNLTLLSKDGNHKYQLKNIFNQIGNNRYTSRNGISAQANMERSAEYYYRSRTAYSSQLAGKHIFKNDAFSWSIGYAYANRLLPDRRRYLVDDAIENGVYALSTGNDISREWTKLDEHILSVNITDDHKLHFGQWQPKIKLGAYGEYRTRKYTTREFIYNWNADENHMPADFRHMDVPTLLSDEANFGEDKLYMLEQVRMRNNYKGNNTIGAGYLLVNLPFRLMDINAGLRYEYDKMELISNTKDTEESHMSRFYKYGDFFPSANMTYRLNDRHQFRLSYGRSINRPEFREVSSSVYYDFDLASSVQGNTELRNCYVDNIDLRYEYYPSKGEQISLAFFYKHFDSPIEWTYTVAGGTDLVYSYVNAHSADNYGLELDIRKNLGFIGLPYFDWSFNGSLIKSQVNFPAGMKEENRPMQGQSPYLINTGVFYHNEQIGFDVALLYNRIGKRIIGVGRSGGTTEDGDNARIPDSYEMPRDAFDLTATKKFGKHLELKATVRDLLNQPVRYMQFAKVSYSDGRHQEVEQVTRKYVPGRNLGFTAIYKF